jgi:hypothetical protein
MESNPPYIADRELDSAESPDGGPEEAPDEGFSPEEAPTSPPEDLELEPIEDPAHQKMVGRLENGVSIRFDGVQARLDALENLARSQGRKISPTYC